MNYTELAICCCYNLQTVATQIRLQTYSVVGVECNIWKYLCILVYNASDGIKQTLSKMQDKDLIVIVLIVNVHFIFFHWQNHANADSGIREASI